MRKLPRWRRNVLGGLRLCLWHQHRHTIFCLTSYCFELPSSFCGQNPCHPCESLPSCGPSSLRVLLRRSLRYWRLLFCRKWWKIVWPVKLELPKNQWLNVCMYVLYLNLVYSHLSAVANTPPAQVKPISQKPLINLINEDFSLKIFSYKIALIPGIFEKKSLWVGY